MPRMPENQWTSTEETLLIMMIAMGATHKEIGLRLGRKEQYIQRKASRMGVLKRKQAQEARRKAEEARLKATEADLSDFCLWWRNHPSTTPWRGVGRQTVRIERPIARRSTPTNDSATPPTRSTGHGRRDRPREDLGNRQP